MKPKLQLVAFMALASFLTPAQETSRIIPFNGVPTTIAPGTLGQTLTIQLWDAAAGGNAFYCENQTLDVDANGNISFNFGAGSTPTPPCASTPPGLKPPDFPTGTSRFLDVVDGTGTSILPNPPGRIPLTAVAFALSAPNDFPGNVTLVDSGATAGNIFKGGQLFLHNFGTQNTFLGQNAGNLTMSGFGDNTAVGFSVLNQNTTGYGNTAMGAFALYWNTTGFDNTAIGQVALYHNTTGYTNTAVGFNALPGNTVGYSNTAVGAGALRNNTTGIFNAALGEGAVEDNNTGGNNTGVGAQALLANASGSDNVGVGTMALRNLGGGNHNIAIGSGAGVNHVSGSNNIDIGYAGFNGDSFVIHLGDQAVHGAAFIGGIYGNPIGGTRQVFINSAGQVTTTSASSRRYKEQIVDQGAESDVLMKLRPVAFYYKPQLDSEHTRQYGLIAEEVAEIAPNLVVFDKDRKPSGVRYDMVNAMLLNEVQKQRQLIEAQQQQIEGMNAELETQQASQQTQMSLLQREVNTLRELLEKRDASLAKVAGNVH